MVWPYDPYFTEREMMCRCGCGRVEMSPDTMQRVLRLRHDWNRGIFVASGYRCIDHPDERKKTGIVNLRPHVEGRAFDASVPPDDRFEYVQLALKHGFTGIGVYRWGVHLDDIAPGPYRPRIW